jgi:hypothetical protein
MKCSGAVVLGLFPLFVNAQGMPKQSPEPGFNGQVSIHIGNIANESHLNTKDNKQIDDLYEKPEQINEVVVFPMWNVKYGFDESELYFKSDLQGMASNFYMELGYRYFLSKKSRLSVGFIPGLLREDTWSDPFVLDQNREKTDLGTEGVVINYDNIAESSFSVELAAGQSVIENEQSGSQTLTEQEQALLVREGDLYYAAVNQSLHFSRTMGLKWELHYLQDNADGEAMQNRAAGLNLQLRKSMGRHTLLFAGKSVKRDFKGVHPIFDETREDDVYGLSLAYVWAAPLNWKNTVLLVRSAWDVTDSNINYYDKTQFLGTVGLSYRF